MEGDKHQVHSKFVFNDGATDKNPQRKGSDLKVSNGFSTQLSEATYAINFHPKLTERTGIPCDLSVKSGSTYAFS